MIKREFLIFLAVNLCFCLSACKHGQAEHSGVKHEISAPPRGRGAIQPGDCKPGSAFNSIKQEADYVDAAKYVENIAKSIIDANPSVFKDDLSFEKFCFYVIRDDEYNAFATPPSANVVFHDSMLVRMRNDAEVATKLAHELAHVTMNHAISLHPKLRDDEIYRQMSKRDEKFSSASTAELRNENIEFYRIMEDVVESIKSDISYYREVIAYENLVNSKQPTAASKKSLEKAFTDLRNILKSVDTPMFDKKSLHRS